MFIEHLTDTDKTLINIFRKIGGSSNDCYTIVSDFCSSEDFLNEWDKEKSKNELIKQIFKNQLIFKKKIETSLPSDKLFWSMNNLLKSYLGQFVKNSIFIMLKKYNDLDALIDDRHFMTIEDVLKNDLFSAKCLLDNKYCGKTIKLKLPDTERPFTLSEGCKGMKAIGKLAKAANIEENFEEFRIQQSQIMNEAYICANLCLSIHPLDYMSASYNNCGWESCMHWEDGEYRRGVIEMMNSPYVIVAYLESNHDVLEFYDNASKETINWNSKKWREFFIVSESGIFGIKGYPYWNRDLEDMTLNWIKELLGDYSSIYSDKITIWDLRTNNNLPVEKIYMSCGPAMYNDFLNGSDFHAIFSKNLDSESIIDIDYSGTASCVVCGGFFGDDDDTECLACDDCLDGYYCETCGRLIHGEDEIHQINGYMYCQSCYEDLPECIYCGDVIDPNNGLENSYVFCIGEKINNNTIFLKNYWGSAQEYYCCKYCTEKIFVDGEAEFDIEHEVTYLNGYRVPIISIDKIKNLELLYTDEGAIEEYKEEILKAKNINK